MARPDPAASRAVLIGVDRYRHLSALPSVANNLRRIAELVRDPDLLGLPPEHCTVLANPTSPERVLDVIEENAEAATDVFLLYFSGHGLTDEDNGHLHLALPDASLARLRRAIRYDDIRSIAMGAVHCRAKVVVLDSCFSGRALVGGMNARTEVAERMRVDGTYLMTASAENALALAPPDEEYTAFTGELIDVLENGIPDGPEFLDVETVWWHVRNELAAKNRPIPQQRARNLGGSILLGRNRHVRPTPEPEQVPAAQPTPEPLRVRLPPQPPRPRPEPLPEPPSGHEDVLRIAPRSVAARAVDLDRDGQPDTALAILRAVGARRDDQEVAAILAELSGAAESQRRAVVDAAVLRPARQVVDLHRALLETDQTTEAQWLLREVARAAPTRIAAIVEATGSIRYRMEVLEQAVLLRIRRPEHLMVLIEALRATGLRNEVDALLDRTPALLAPDGAAILGDALRLAGEEAAAFRCYESAVPVLAARPLTDAVALAAAIEVAGNDALATGLIDAIADRASSVPAAIELLDVLKAAGLPHRLTAVLNRAAARLDAPGVVALAAVLRERGLATNTVDLYVAALPGRPANSIAALHQALSDAGRPIDAMRLLDEAAARLDVATLAAVAEVLNPTAADRLLQATVAAQPVHLTRLLTLLDDAQIERCIGLLRPDQILAAALEEPWLRPRLISDAVRQEELEIDLARQLSAADAGEFLVELAARSAPAAADLAHRLSTERGNTAIYDDAVVALARRPVDQIRAVLDQDTEGRLTIPLVASAVVFPRRGVLEQLLTANGESVPGLVERRLDRLVGDRFAVVPVFWAMSVLRQFGHRESVHRVVDRLCEPFRETIDEILPLLHLARLMNESGWSDELDRLTSGTPFLPREALGDDGIAAAVVGLNLWAGRHPGVGQRYRLDASPVDRDNGKRACELLGVDREMPLALVHPAKIGRGSDFILFTDVAIHHHCGGLIRYDHKILPYERLARARFATDGDMVMVQPVETNLQLWRLSGQKQEVDWVMDVLAAMRDAVKAMIAYRAAGSSEPDPVT